MFGKPIAARIFVSDQKGEPVQLYKDAACTEPHAGKGVIVVGEDGIAPPAYQQSPTKER